MKSEANTSIVSTPFIQRRQWLYLALLAAAVFFLIPHLIGIPRAIRILSGAHPQFLLIALLAEISRYFASAASTRVLGRVFRRVIPFEPTVEAFFAGCAANRTFSTGGAPGMLVRYFFLIKHQIASGQVAVIYLIEDVAGLVIGGLIFLVGTVTLALAPSTTGTVVILVFGFPIVSLLLTAGAVYLYRRREMVSQVVRSFTRACDRIARFFFSRPVYDPEAIEHSIDQFYIGMSAARMAPVLVIAALAYNLIRYAAGIAAVYFCFLALGSSISAGALILIYTSASVLSTISAVPGELAILGGSWAILTLSFGVPRETAMLALVISRTIAFWLPIPVGSLALWNLRRQNRI